VDSARNEKRRKAEAVEPRCLREAIVKARERAQALAADVLGVADRLEGKHPASEGASAAVLAQ
jgi:hypothetical protein